MCMSTSVIQHCAGVFGIINAIWLAQEHDTALIEEETESWFQAQGATGVY